MVEMKYTLLKSVPYEAISDRLPPELRGPLPPSEAQTYTVIVFEPGRVVHSGLAAKAIRRSPSGLGPPTLAIATSCTLEAQELLRAAGVLLVERRPWHSTDRSHEEIKVLIGAKVKKPDHR